MKAVLRRPVPTHPLAVPPIPDGFGVWQVRRVPEAPLGYVRSEHRGRDLAYHCYAHGRDDAGGRPWLHTASSLNSAVAWLLQHESELGAQRRGLRPEPEAWPR
ncbi:hypothetical protein EDF38_0513 [Frigoribacterium sp. PhB160]|nr:hypothetical protein EDF38_0513 [Frigoribacterium sp. PhB160]